MPEYDVSSKMDTDMNTQKFPWWWWAIPLMLLASFRYEHHSESGSSFWYDGTSTAIMVMGIASLVMIFGITKRVQSVLRAHNIIDNLPKSRFWILLPLSIILPGIGYRALSETGFKDDVADKFQYHWEFNWGATPLHGWLIAGSLAVIFLHTVVLTLSEIEGKANRS